MTELTQKVGTVYGLATGMTTLAEEMIHYGDWVRLPGYKHSFPVTKPAEGYNAGLPTVDVGNDVYALESYISWGATVVKKAAGYQTRDFSRHVGDGGKNDRVR